MCRIDILGKRNSNVRNKGGMDLKVFTRNKGKMGLPFERGGGKQVGLGRQLKDGMAFQPTKFILQSLIPREEE